MNIYRIIEDGEHILIKAKTMAEAINICLKAYLEDEEEDHNLKNTEDEFNAEREAQYYYDVILESCELLGALKN